MIGSVRRWPDEDSAMRKTFAWLRRHGFVVLMLLTVGIATAAWWAVRSPRHIDLDHFNQIQLDMTADEVELILGGSPGRFGIPGGWATDLWFRWKGRNGNLQVEVFGMGDDRLNAGRDSRVWQLTNFDRSASILIFLDENGKVRGAQFAQSDF
jgi:hypothetical protein